MIIIRIIVKKTKKKNSCALYFYLRFLFISPFINKGIIETRN